MLLMASATMEKLACLRKVPPLEEQLELSPRMKSCSRNAKKEKIHVEQGWTDPGTLTSKE